MGEVPGELRGSGAPIRQSSEAKGPNSGAQRDKKPLQHVHIHKDRDRQTDRHTDRYNHESISDR